MMERLKVLLLSAFLHQLVKTFFQLSASNNIHLNLINIFTYMCTNSCLKSYERKHLSTFVILYHFYAVTNKILYLQWCKDHRNCPRSRYLGNIFEIQFNDRELHIQRIKNYSTTNSCTFFNQWYLPIRLKHSRLSQCCRCKSGDRTYVVEVGMYSFRFQSQ
jgi:hypothetical protein